MTASRHTPGLLLAAGAILAAVLPACSSGGTTTLCHSQAHAVSGGTYTIMNNEWHSSAAQCITNPYFVGAQVPVGAHYRRPPMRYHP